MKKKYVYVLVGFILILLSSIVLLDVNKSNETKETKEDVALKNVIIEIVQTSNEIDLAKATNFDWDTMYVFTPYSNPIDILIKDGISTYNSRFSIEVLDTINMIGFIKSNKLVAFVELPRSSVEVDLRTPSKFTKNEAYFNVLKDKKTIIFDHSQMK